MPRVTPVLSILVLLFFLIGDPRSAIAEPVELTSDVVEARIGALRADGAADDDKTLRAYDSALTWLEAAASFDTDAKTYLDSLASAPKREEEIQARIDRGEATKAESIDIENLKPAELGRRLATTRTELRGATESLETIEKKLAARETNADLIRTRLTQISERSRELADVEPLIEPNASPSLAEAELWTKGAELIALAAERKAQEARLSSQPVRYSAMRAESAELALRIQVLNERVQGLESAARSTQAQIEQPSEPDIGADAPAYPLAGRLTTENAQLREKQLEVEASLSEISANLARVEQATRILDDRLATAHRLVEFAPESEALGRVLLAYWNELKSLALATPVERLSGRVGDTVISRIDHEKSLGRLVDARRYMDTQLKAAGLEIETLAPSDLDALIALAMAQRKLMRQLIAIESDHIEALTKLDTARTRLRDLFDQYKDFLSGLILWIPSHPRLWLVDFRAISAEVLGLPLAVTGFRMVLSPLAILALAAAFVLFSLQAPFRKIQRRQNLQIRKPRSDSIRFTLVALLVTALRALPLSLGFVAVGALNPNNFSGFAVAASQTLVGLGIALYALTLVRHLNADDGLARIHFRWRPQLCERLHQEIGWLIRWWLPIAGLSGFLYLMGDDTELLGRISLLVAMALIAGHLVRQVRRKFDADGDRRLTSNENSLRLCLIAFVLLISIAEIFGLRHTVSIVTDRLLITLYVGIGLLIAHNLLIRWMLVTRRRLDLEQRLASQADRDATEAAGVEEDEVALVDVGAETTRLLNAATFTAAVFALIYVWLPLLPVVDAADQFVLWTSATIVDGETVTTKITLETLIVVVFLVGITFYAVRKLPALVELVLRSRSTITPSARYTASTLLSYVIVGAGIIMALSRLGLQWSQLQWLVAALGVGIGFGLQEIIANFISGLIILFERPIRVGDIVTVSEKNGTVTKIRIRATTIRDFDGKELLVPNKEFITGQLLNWTLSDATVRLVIPVGVAYGSNVEQALEILESIAKDNTSVLNDPQPNVIFSNFGDNALDLALRIFIGSLSDWRAVMTDIRREIYRRFNEAGIVIAFPQRDVHIDADKPIRIAIDQSPAT